MKKLYFLAILALIATTSFAQRSVDLQLTHPFLSDTVKIQNPNTTAPTYVVWGVVNNGPDTIATTDSIFLRLGGLGTTYYFINATIPVGDTLFSIDTFFFNDGPASGAAQWCDSIWINGIAANDVNGTNVANDEHCEAIWIKNTTTGVAELFNSRNNIAVGSLNVFPNPATNNVSFKFDLKGTEGTVTLRDITGRVVYQEQLAKSYGEKLINISVASFTNGLYMVELNTEDSRNVGRIMIQK